VKKRKGVADVPIKEDYTFSTLKKLRLLLNKIRRENTNVLF